ncbi:MAG: SGNH/GDSL hydrolase family protein [Silvanigrellaceae bacterium]|nr:SGNH/GDSL hydrolase family protein [Silvanigrellaceae bacterium]
MGRILSLVAFCFVIPSLFCSAQDIDDLIAQGTDLRKVVVFGDSLSDDGNIAPHLLYSMPRSPYWHYRFSNGPIWCEQLADILHIPLKNYAYGGAESNRYVYPSSNLEFRFRVMAIPSVISEVKNYVNKFHNFFSYFTPGYKPANKKLYVIWIGANNYLDKYNEPILMTETGQKNDNLDFVRDTVFDIRQSLELLYKNGGRNFLVPNLPDLGKTPWAKSENLVEVFSYLTKEHNRVLAETIDDFKKLFPSAKIALLDVAAFFNDQYLIEQTFGIKNITSPCYSGGYTGTKDTSKVCSNPNDYLFWDTLHPTAKGHCMLSYVALDALHKAEIVPLPANIDFFVKNCSNLPLLK